MEYINAENSKTYQNDVKSNSNYYSNDSYISAINDDIVFEKTYIGESLSLPGQYIFEIFIILVVITVDIFFICTVLCRKHLRFEKLCWIPLTIVFIMCTSSAGYFILKIIGHNSVSFWSQYFELCIVLKIILESCHYSIPVFLIVNTVFRMVAELKINHKESSEKLICLTIVFVFFTVAVWQSFITYFFGYAIRILSPKGQSHFVCSYMSPHVLQATTVFDITTLSTLIVITLITCAMTKHNSVMCLLNIIVSILKILWPIGYFLNERLNLTIHLNYWFFYANIVSNGFVPLVWLFFDMKYEFCKKSKYIKPLKVRYSQELMSLIDSSRD